MQKVVPKLDEMQNTQLAIQNTLRALAEGETTLIPSLFLILSKKHVDEARSPRPTTWRGKALKRIGQVASTNFFMDDFYIVFIDPVDMTPFELTDGSPGYILSESESLSEPPVLWRFILAEIAIERWNLMKSCSSSLCVATSPCFGSEAAASAGPCVRSTSMVRPPSPCGSGVARSQPGPGGTCSVCGEACEVVALVPFLGSPVAVLPGVS